MILQKSFFILKNPTRVAAGNAHCFYWRSKICNFRPPDNLKKLLLHYTKPLLPVSLRQTTHHETVPPK